MSEAPAFSDRLDSWKEIAAYINRSVRTVIRWEEERDLPVHRIPGGHRQNVYAFRHEIDEWLQSGQTSPYISIGFAKTQNPQEPNAGSTHPLTGSLPGINPWLFRAGAFVTLFALVALAVWFLAGPHPIQFSGIRQLTSDGVPKEGLVTDGQHLYFSERRNGRFVLAEVSVTGGPIRIIPTQLTGPIPESISPDGKQLLVLNHDGEEDERTLWSVRADNGEPHRVGDIWCHSAAWSPDGRRIAYATGNEIYLFEKGVARKIQDFPGVPQFLLWSLDGSRIRFELKDLATGGSALWELVFGGPDALQLSSILPLHVSYDHGFSCLAMLDANGRSFLTLAGPPQNKIWLLEKLLRPTGSQYALTELNGQLAGISQLALDRDGRQLFALSGLSAGNELVRFNRSTQDFKPFLPGISAKDVDFSSDGQLIAYVSSDGASLWISRPDGSDKRQVNCRYSDIELPHWSPQGRRIAFMARRPEGPWRIFIVSAEGGIPKEASQGTDNQGAGTWSPDGRWLIYGNVNCQEAGTCAIHKIDVTSGKVVTVPGSEGMETARWSPDGHLVAALLPEREQVFVLDLRAGRWRKLADGINGNDLSWSPDSRYVYASRPNGTKPEVLRISIADGTAQPAVDLSDFSKLPGRVDTWFGLAPDESIIFIRCRDQSEVYALHYREM